MTSAARRCCALLLTLLSAAAATAYPAAGADELVVSPSGSFTATSSNLTFAYGLGTVTCSATLQGTLSRTTPFDRTSAAGTVTSARFGSCLPAGAVVTVLGLPWTIRFSDVVLGGALGVSGYEFTLLNAQIGITTITPCLFRGPLVYREAIDGAWQSRAFALTGNAVPYASGSPLCGASVRANGSFTRSAGVALTLIPDVGFGAQTFDFSTAPATPQEVTVTNLSTIRASDLMGFTIQGADSADFAHDLVGIHADDRCENPKRLPAGEICKVRVRFVGGAGPSTASLVLSHDNTTTTANLTR